MPQPHALPSDTHPAAISPADRGPAGSDPGLPGPATSPPGISDESLAAEARSGSRSAFGLLVERHGGGVLALFEHRIGEASEAQDLAQDVWLKVHRGLAGYDPARAFRPWLYGIALNHLRDRMRRRARSPFTRARSLQAVEGDDPRASLGSDPSGRVEEHAVIHEALARVGEPFRGALVLVDVLGLGYAEAAEGEGCAEGTMKSRVSRGRAAFRKAYLELSGEPQPESGSESEPEPELPPRGRAALGLS